MRATKRTDPIKVLALFLAAYLAHATLMWLPNRFDFEITGFGLAAYASLTLLPILIILGLYVFTFWRADEFFQRLTLVSTSVAFLLAGGFSLVSLTFARFGMESPPAASTFNVMVVCWLLSYSFFLWRSR